MIENKDLVKTIDKTDLEEKELENLFHKTVESFRLRWRNKGTEISPSGMWNYAMSIMRYEFHKKFDKEKSKELVEIYNPNK